MQVSTQANRNYYFMSESTYSCKDWEHLAFQLYICKMYAFSECVLTSKFTAVTTVQSPTINQHTVV